MRDDPGAPCPKCGAAATRQFFPAGIVFKGSGFYKTDSRGAASSSITSDSGDSKSTSNGAKTDNGTKNSARGRVAVSVGPDGKLMLTERATAEHLGLSSHLPCLAPLCWSCGTAVSWSKQVS